MLIKKRKRPQVMTGKGKEYSEVGVQTEVLLSQWLAASNMTEDELIYRLEGDTFNIGVFFEGESMNIIMFDEESGNIGVPIVLNNAELESSTESRMDAALLLLHISQKTTNAKVENKIREFAKKLV